MLLNHGLGDRLLSSATDAALLRDGEDMEASSSNDTTTSSFVKWELCSEEKQQVGYRLCLEHSKVQLLTVAAQTIDPPQTVKQVTWHYKGDYFASVVSEGTLFWPLFICEKYWEFLKLINDENLC